MKNFHRLLPWIVLVLGVVYIGAQYPRPQSSTGFDFDAFGQIPVSAEGRTKPLDTVARNNLMLLSSKQSLRTGERIEAIEWLADVMAGSEKSRTHPAFRVDHPDLVSLLGRNEEEGKMFSYNELLPHFQELGAQVQRAAQVESRERTPFAKAVIQLERRVIRHMELERGSHPYALAPIGGQEDWAPVSAQTGGIAQGVSMEALSRIFHAYLAGEHQAFNTEVYSYLELVRAELPEASRRSSFEVLFNGANPFIHGMVFYVFAFVLACVSFLIDAGRRVELARSIGRSAVVLITLAFIVHTFGLGMRIYLQGRPPVTNLYSSAIFIGWGTVAAGAYIERLFPIKVAAIASSAIGFATLVVAHNLGGSGDTMEMMQAVLDSNFWLATHVITITLGYSATFLAGFLATIFILLGVFTRRLDTQTKDSLGRMVYGVVCFALLLSFVGTVLGGIWADQSWGRFWGWDPKENGALLIVIMNALIIHARMCGMVRERGMMILAVSGNIVTAWSWFGTNMLGVGLHSYGFMDSAAMWLMLFIVSQLLLMCLGGIPERMWRSRDKQSVRIFGD